MDDKVTETFKCPIEMSKQLPLLAQLSGFDGKSEYIRHLIEKDLELHQRKAALYEELITTLPSNTKSDEVISET